MPLSIHSQKKTTILIRMMQLGKTAQYAVSAVLAVYVVFFTRPAPVFVVRFLSSPIAQLAVLAAIVYVGACMSLLVALVAAVALVLSIPSREYMVDKEVVKEAVEEANRGSPSPSSMADMIAKMPPAVDPKKKPAEPKPSGADDAAQKPAKQEGFANETLAPF
jgi:hypothetical protein